MSKRPTPRLPGKRHRRGKPLQWYCSDILNDVFSVVVSAILLGYVYFIGRTIVLASCMATRLWYALCLVFQCLSIFHMAFLGCPSRRKMENWYDGALTLSGFGLIFWGGTFVEMNCVVVVVVVVIIAGLSLFSLLRVCFTLYCIMVYNCIL